MLSRSSRSLRSSTRIHPIIILALRQFTTQTTTATTQDQEASYSAARTWLSSLTIDTIPRKASTQRFARSSGPGGQNANNSDTKACITWDWEDLEPHVPPLILAPLADHRYCAKAARKIVIQSQEYRKRKDNVDACYRKLYETLVELGRKYIPAERDQKVQARIERQEKASNEVRLSVKKQHSSKKQARKGGSVDY